MDTGKGFTITKETRDHKEPTQRRCVSKKAKMGGERVREPGPRGGPGERERVKRKRGNPPGRKKQFTEKAEKRKREPVERRFLETKGEGL